VIIIFIVRVFILAFIVVVVIIIIIIADTTPLSPFQLETHFFVAVITIDIVKIDVGDIGISSGWRANRRPETLLKGACFRRCTARHLSGSVAGQLACVKLTSSRQMEG